MILDWHRNNELSKRLDAVAGVGPITAMAMVASFIVSASSPKTVVNKTGYRIDLLINKAVEAMMASAQPWKPQALDGQEWLLAYFAQHDRWFRAIVTDGKIG